MSKYANMFAVDPTNLFGQTKQDTSVEGEIKAWIAISGVETSVARIKYLLNDRDVKTLTDSQIIDIGANQISEASEANKLVDKTVTEFARLKAVLEGPKSLILEVIAAIEGDTRPQGWIARLIAAKQEPNWAMIKVETDAKLKLASAKMQNCAKYHIGPFLDTLKHATCAVTSIEVQLNNTINTLRYIADKSPDPSVQDRARHRMQTFAKSCALMQMNIGQLHSMDVMCEQNKEFATELEMNIIPVINNIMRTKIIDGDNSLQNLATQLKGIL